LKSLNFPSEEPVITMNAPGVVATVVDVIAMESLLLENMLLLFL